MKSWANMAESSNSSVIEFVSVWKFLLSFYSAFSAASSSVSRAYSSSRMTYIIFTVLGEFIPAAAVLGQSTFGYFSASGPTGSNRRVSPSTWQCLCRMWLWNVWLTESEALIGRLSNRLWFFMVHHCIRLFLTCDEVHASVVQFQAYYELRNLNKLDAVWLVTLNKMFVLWLKTFKCHFFAVCTRTCFQ
jgi:hypothetical protein